MKNQNTILLFLAIISLTACGTSNSDRAISGGAIGAGVGAVGTSVIGGNPLTGAVIGAGVGAATGVLTKRK